MTKLIDQFRQLLKVWSILARSFNEMVKVSLCTPGKPIAHLGKLGCSGAKQRCKNIWVDLMKNILKDYLQMFAERPV